MWPDDETPEPAAWINFNAATGERNVSFVCESELASIPLWPEPPRGHKPLTDEQKQEIRKMHPTEDLCGWSYGLGIADAERHHGITKGDQT
jgi:hypothetical protein